MLNRLLYFIISGSIFISCSSGSFAGNELNTENYTKFAEQVNNAFQMLTYSLTGQPGLAFQGLSDDSGNSTCYSNLDSSTDIDEDGLFLTSSSTFNCSANLLVKGSITGADDDDNDYQSVYSNNSSNFIYEYESDKELTATHEYSAVRSGLTHVFSYNYEAQLSGSVDGSIDFSLSGVYSPANSSKTNFQLGGSVSNTSNTITLEYKDSESSHYVNVSNIVLKFSALNYTTDCDGTGSSPENAGYNSGTIIATIDIVDVFITYQSDCSYITTIDTDNTDD